MTTADRSIPTVALTAASLAGIGCGWGFVLYRAIFVLFRQPEELPHFLGLAAVLLLLTLTFYQRLEEILLRLLGNETHAVFPSRALWMLRWLGLILIEVLFLLTHHEVDRNLALTIKDLGSAILLAGAITYAWLIGTIHSRTRAARFGLATGFVLGTLYVILVLFVKTKWPFGKILGIAIGNGLTLWGFLGLAGGLVLDRLKSLRPSLTVTIAIVAVVMLGDWLWALPGEIMIPSWPSDLAMLAGWSLGLVLWPTFDQLVTASRQPSVVS
jgi:hypothetical protein